MDEATGAATGDASGRDRAIDQAGNRGGADPSGDPVNAVQLDIADHVATIWLDRPAKRNAVTWEMWTALEAACRTITASAGVRAVLVRGRGEHFCAGAAIEDLRKVRPLGERSFMEVNAAAEQALAELLQPTVALIDGDCIGGGCALALDCDVRVATPRARFGITPAKLGVVYPPASVERVVAALGATAAKRMLLTGDLFDAAWALDHGLIDEIVEDIDEAARRWSAGLAKRSLLSQAAAKEMVAAVSRHGEVPHEIADRWQRHAAHSTDLDEGIAAFAERREPRFGWAPDGLFR